MQHDLLSEAVTRIFSGEDPCIVLSSLCEKADPDDDSVSLIQNRMFLPGSIGSASVATLQKSLTGKIANSKLANASSNALGKLTHKFADLAPSMATRHKEGLKSLMQQHAKETNPTIKDILAKSIQKKASGKGIDFLHKAGERLAGTVELHRSLNKEEPKSNLMQNLRRAYGPQKEKIGKLLSKVAPKVGIDQEKTLILHKSSSLDEPTARK